LLHKTKHGDRAYPEDRPRRTMQKTSAGFEDRELMREKHADLGARERVACPSIFHFAP
jgi:hypothetical protein